MIRSLPFNIKYQKSNFQCKEMYGSYARKFNGEKLKSPEISSAYREKLNEYLTRHADDNDNNDNVNEVWTCRRNAITQTAGTILDRI